MENENTYSHDTKDNLFIKYVFLVLKIKYN